MDNVTRRALSAFVAVLGLGGSGSTHNAPLPPGTRQVFKLTNGGFRGIPFQQAAAAMVSAIPTSQSGTA